LAGAAGWIDRVGGARRIFFKGLGAALSTILSLVPLGSDLAARGLATGHLSDFEPLARPVAILTSTSACVATGPSELILTARCPACAEPHPGREIFSAA
jgi:hypothetical protein